MQSQRSITMYRVRVALDRARPGERLAGAMQFEACQAIATYSDRYDTSCEASIDNHVVVTHGASAALALKRACDRAGVDAAIIDRRFGA